MEFNPHDPKNYAGVWYALHKLAMEAKRQLDQKGNVDEEQTRNLKTFLANAIIAIIFNLGCQTCINHAREFLHRRPIQKTFDGDNFAMFYWTVDLHNHANINTGKSIMSHEDARKLYYESKCDSCHLGTSVENPTLVYSEL